MCGIVGIISKDTHSIANDTLRLLKRLEYRGYDSAGVATLEGEIQKDVGSISPFLEGVTDHLTTASIAHTRWATHGGVTPVNAHPHADQSGEFMVVHNGILENAGAIGDGLNGQTFVSETDTEIIAGFFHDRVVGHGKTIPEAIHEFIELAEGTYGLLLMRRGENDLYAVKHNSPLAMARSESVNGGCAIFASDISAFSGIANEAVFFEDHTYCRANPDGIEFFDAKGVPIVVPAKSFEWGEESVLDTYSHYMIKEIMEQPTTSLRLLESLETMQRQSLETFAKYMKQARRIVFLSCGTSYHASLIGAFLLSRLNYEAHTVVASEFQNFILVDASTFVIVISQSGETMDVIIPLKQIADRVGHIGAIVNVPYSTIHRISDVSLDLLAGPEIAVASTKAYTNQVVMLMALAEQLGSSVDCSSVPGKIQKALESLEPKCMELAKELASSREVYVLGRGAAYPMAREIALKLKEIDYIHAEGMMSGELKHGTLALIEDGTPVICLMHGEDAAMLSSIREVRARGASTIVVSNVDLGDVMVPDGCEAEFAIYTCMFGHLLSYYIGVERGLPIDKPRNLAKSVTVT